VIVFELICAGQHRFEGWFASGEEFEHQRLGGLLSCPVCSTGDITKLPTAKLKRSGEGLRAGTGHRAPEPAAGSMTVAAFVDLVLKHTEDVGRAFPEEARKIHREEAPRRGIRGIATREETEALLEDGITVVPLPIPPREDFH
jgi:hypothetical protein